MVGYRHLIQSRRPMDGYCHLVQEVRTVRGAQNGIINPTFAIFKLKQKCYGWTDKQEVESTNTNINYNYEAELSELVK